MSGERDEQRYSSAQMVRYEAAAPDQRVERSWSATLASVSRVVGNTTSAVATHSLTLYPDGRFERGGFSGASFTGETGNTRSGGTVGHAAPTRAGRYRIDGYSIALDYDDGAHESAHFYWAGGKDDRYAMLFLNGGRYLGGLRH